MAHESNYRIAQCIGIANLAQCLGEWEEGGINPRFVVFCGLAEAPGLLSAKEAVPAFVVVGVVAMQRGGWE